MCLKITLEQQLNTHLVTQKCPGPKPSVQVDAMTAHGHTVARTVADVPIIFCTRCGAFTARRAYGLAAPCRGRPTGPGAQALARIRRGLQPWQRPAAPRARTHMATEAWAADQRSFIGHGPTGRRGRRRATETERAARDEGEHEPDENALGGDGDAGDVHIERSQSMRQVRRRGEGSTEEQTHVTAEGMDTDPLGDQGSCWEEPPAEWLTHEPGIIDDAYEDADPFGHGGDLDMHDGPADTRAREQAPPGPRVHQHARQGEDSAHHHLQCSVGEPVTTAGASAASGGDIVSGAVEIGQQTELAPRPEKGKRLGGVPCGRVQGLRDTGDRVSRDELPIWLEPPS